MVIKENVLIKEADTTDLAFLKPSSSFLSTFHWLNLFPGDS